MSRLNIFKMIRSSFKHILHLIGLFTLITLSIRGLKRIQMPEDFDPWVEYGFLITLFMYTIRYLTFLTVPQVLFNFCGLVMYNVFPEKVTLKGSPLLAPFICFRVVTRGDYPELVKSNIMRNMNTCLDTGLENFSIEIVTDKALNLAKHRRVREVVVPTAYKTKSGALFKSRALQYCLEDDVNILNNNDWIVHLDEETLLTENGVRGIINFVLDGKHPFGQGLITYANENVVNWLTTLADSIRVSDDMGKLRFQFKMFHKPLFSWKGSFVVSQVAAERDVSFDNGLDGSVAEDCYFAMLAFSKGYTFDFIDGEMFEKSPFTLMDFLQQRKRWLQGIYLVVNSKRIPMKYKFLLSMSFYSWLTMPLSSSNFIWGGLYPIPNPAIIDYLVACIGGIYIYMYVFGVMKSFSLYRFGVIRFVFSVAGAVCTIPLNAAIENVAVLWGIIAKKHKFYVVQKEVRSLVTV